jgi:peptidoglycan/LPS O-acetylase OafA/YrhL
LNRLAQWQSWVLFLASWPLYGLFQHYQLTEMGSQLLLRWIGAKWHYQAEFSKFFINDYLLALIIAANFIGYRGVAHHFSAVLFPLEKPIRWLAGFTFSLYILHQPLLQFYAAVFNGDPSGPLFYFEMMAATLLSVGIIGAFTEHKRYQLRTWIRSMLVAMMATNWWRRSVTATLANKQVGI